uniref:N-acetyltransferase domain-containing protein n=1 Tax=Setaria digitata TaxID=48799 RepID=A0A915PX55_9BILA
MKSPDHIKLEPLKEVLKRQIPINVGEPIPMIVYDIDHPKNCGDPWIGAYSKHGFWYKFTDGTNDDYEKVVARAYESDSYKIDYGSMKVWKNAAFFNCKFIVAKNQSDEVLGSIAVACFNNFAVIGVYYVIEEYRHSVSHLASKCCRFGLAISLQQKWKFVTYQISNPSAFPTLQEREVTIVKYSDLSEAELVALMRYDTDVVHLNRNLWLREWLQRENLNVCIAFKENTIVGYGCSREVAGGYVLPLLVGPLYADDFKTASALLHASLEKYYKPDEDYDWDPDIFAIYRRNVYFIVPEQNTQMIALMDKFRGEGGIVSKDRLYYITQSTHNLPDVEFERVFAVSDIHLFPI